jgi:hypothetical protein
MEDREVLLGHANYSKAGYYAGADVGRLLQQANLVLNRRGTHTVKSLILAPRPGLEPGTFRFRDLRSASGMRRSTLLELSGMEPYKVAHVRRRFARELVEGARHAVVTSLPGQLGHG